MERFSQPSLSLRPTHFPSWVQARFCSADWSLRLEGSSQRALLARAEGFALENMTFAEQTHSDHVSLVGPEDVGRGSASLADRILDSDALVSNTPGALLCILTADCVPVLLCDTARRAVAAIHSGWRGTAANIVGKTVAEMSRFLDSRPEDICAAVGPHIRAKSYAVGSDVIDAIGSHYARPLSGGQTGVDLTAAVIDQLRTAGVSSVEDCGVDTFAQSQWPSYRRDKTSCRLLSVIGISSSL